MGRFILCLLLLVSFLAERCWGQEATKPYNILLIVADDLGIELGCYGDPQAVTPNIDRLAKEGVRFEVAWVTAASCSPSRGSIHTGLYPHQNGLVGLAHHGFSMDKEYPTIASELHEAGYRTGIIGKFHIAPKDQVPWDYYVVPEEDPRKPQLNRKLLGKNRDVRTMASMAEGFIAENAGPFFLMMSYVDPHVPLHHQALGLPEKPLTPEEVDSLPFLGFESPRLKARTAGYYNCIHRLDAGIGLLLEALQRQGKEENTLVILIGDHGAPFMRAKGSCYDRGLRIPFIVRAPGMKSIPGLEQQPVSTVDIFPTVADYAGIQPPVNLPGISLRPWLEGRRKVDPNRPLFASHYAHQKDAVFPMRAVRKNNRLLIVNQLGAQERPRPGIDGSPSWPSADATPAPSVPVDQIYNVFRKPPRIEFYDLAQDPYCFENLADSSSTSAQRQALQKVLQTWRESTGDPLLGK